VHRTTGATTPKPSGDPPATTPTSPPTGNQVHRGSPGLSGDQTAWKSRRAVTKTVTKFSLLISGLALLLGVLAKPALMLVAHRPDDRWACVSCSIRQRHPWKDCVHADAARVAAQRLKSSDFRTLKMVITPGYQSGALARGVKRVIDSIESES
jgi:hypothetical protein